MSFLGRSYESVVDTPGLAGAFQARARQAYAQVSRMPAGQQRRLAQRLQAFIDRLPPDRKQQYYEMMRRRGDFNPRALHGLGAVATASNIAQSIAALASIGLAFHAQREDRKLQEKQLSEQAKAEKERLEFEREQARLQLAAAQQQQAQPQQQAGMSKGTKTALIAGGAVAGTALLVAATK